MKPKISEIVSEIERIKNELEQAQQEDLIFVHPECGDDLQPMFTAEQLLKEINEGNWHCVRWDLIPRTKLKNEFLQKITHLQNQLVKL